MLSPYRAGPPQHLANLANRENPAPVLRILLRVPGMARDRPSPYGVGGPFFSPSCGGLSPAISRCMQHGEGQALALRCWGGRSFHRSAGACPPRSLGCTPDEPPSVVCDRQITNRSGSGDPELQRETKTVLFTVARGPVPAMPCLGSPAVPLTLAARLSSSPSPIDRLLTPPQLRAVRLCHR